MHHTQLHNEHAPGSLEELWFKLRGVELLRDGWMEQKLIESHTLIIVKNGVGRLTIDLQDYQLQEESLHVARPGQTIGASSGATDELELYIVKFDVMQDTVQHPRLPLNGQIAISPVPQAITLCELMYTHSRSDQALERFRGQSVFQELLYWIMKQIRIVPDSDSRTALAYTKAYIDTHYHENLTIEQLARMANVSPKYYVDLFKKTYGKSTMDYVTEVRISSAKKVMMQSNVRLRNVAHQVGYNDEFYFSRKFKKEVGVSPTVYMKTRRRKIVAYSSPVLGHLLALKMIPYAAPLHPKWSAYYHKVYRTDIPLHLSAYRFNEDWESNIETLVHAEPDMVISIDELHTNEKSQLEKIAPVFLIPWKEKNWREHLLLTAQLLDVSQEAEAWLRNYELKIKLAREHLNRELKNETILVMSIFKQQYRFCPTRGMRDVLFHDLQLNGPGGFNAAEHNQLITAEQLAQMDADRILVNICQEPESLSQWQSLQSSLLWQDLKAVRKNQVSSISSDPWREYSAYASERIVDDLLRLVQGHHPN